MNLRRTLAHDRAENSIMQTITIATIAIIIAAGMLTMPGLSQSLRATTLKNDLAALSQAQDFMFAQNGAYLANSQQGELTNGKAGIKVQVSEGTRIALATNELTVDDDVSTSKIEAGRYIIIGQTKGYPGIRKISTGAMERIGVPGIYMYKDSRCEEVWVGTSVPGEIVANQPQDKVGTGSKDGVQKRCTKPWATTAAGKDIIDSYPMKLYTPNTPSAPPAGTEWVY